MNIVKTASIGAGIAAAVGAGTAALIAGIGAALQLARLVIYMVAGVPIYFVWNELAPIYFTFLPEVYRAIPYWHIVGFLWLFGVITRAIVPKFSSTVTQNNGKEG